MSDINDRSNQQPEQEKIDSPKSALKPPKISVHVKINPMEDIHVFEKDSNARESSSKYS